MFRCEVTGRVSQPGEKMHRIVVETRPKVYHERRATSDGYRLVEVGSGWEIVKELRATAEGVRVWEQQQQKVAA